MRQRMKTYPLTYEALYSGEPIIILLLRYHETCCAGHQGGTLRAVAGQACGAATLPVGVLLRCFTCARSPGESCLLCCQLNFLLLPLCRRGPLVQPADGPAQRYGGECMCMFRRCQVNALFPRLACRGGWTTRFPAWGATCRSHARGPTDPLLLPLPLATCGRRQPPQLLHQHTCHS